MTRSLPIKKWRGLAALAAGALLASGLATHAAAPRYHIQEMPTLGGNASTAYGLNEQGAVVGSARDAAGMERPVIFSGGTLTALPDLGFGGIAYGINASRHVTGAVATGVPYSRPWDNNTSVIDNVALWNEQGLVNLGNLGGLPRGEGRIITDDGWIVGTASAPLPSVPGEDIWQRAFIKTGNESAIRDAGTFPGDIRSFIFDLNASRQAPGFSVSDNRGGPAQTAAGLWQFDANGQVLSITPLQPFAAGKTGVALGINDAGDIVGRSATDTDQQVAVIWRAGQTTPELLPVLESDPGNFVRAWQINNHGLAVGELRAGSNPNDRYATLWQDLGHGYERLDLQQLILNGSGWDLQGALAINNAGQIVGYGLKNGQQRGFLLTPLPGKLYAVGGFDPDDTGKVPHRIYELDPVTGQATPLPGSFGPEPAGLAATADGRLLALDLPHSHGPEPAPDQSTLLEIDPYKGFLTKLAIVPAQATGFDILPDGRAFTIPLPGGAAPVQLHAVNPGSGALTAIGSASAIDDAFAAAFGSAPAANKRATQLASVGGHLYAAVRHGSIANLVRFDPGTGAATVIGAANAVNTSSGGAYRGIPGLSGRDSDGDGVFDELYGVLNYHDHDGNEETPFQVVGALIKFNLNDGTWSLVGTNPGLLFSGLASTAGLNPTPVPFGYTFESFSAPAALETYGGGINNLGQVAGTYLRDVPGGPPAYGLFVRDQDGMFATYDLPNGQAPSVQDINEAGLISGFYLIETAEEIFDGFGFTFLPANNAFQIYRFPAGAPFTDTAINAVNDAGNILLGHFDTTGNFDYRGFLYDTNTGVLTQIDGPTPGLRTFPYGMNQAGVVVGRQGAFGFIFQNNQYTTHQYGTDGRTRFNDINAAGTVVGYTFAGKGRDRSFVFQGGAFAEIAFPGAQYTHANAINDAGVIVGEIVTGKGEGRGFIARPAPKLSRGEVDIRLVFHEGELEFHVHDESNGVEYDPAGVVLAAGTAAEQPIPDTLPFQFLGRPGHSVWILPAAENEDLLHLGLAAEEIEGGVFVNNALRVELVSVEGAGGFFLYTTDAFGMPQVRMNSADGISASDFFPLTAGSHQHVNWAFGAPGSYRIGLRATGTLVAGNAAIASEVVYFTFHIPAAELPEPVEPDDTFVYKVALLELEGAKYVAGEEVNETGVVAVGAYDGSDVPVAARFADELTLLAPLTPRGAYASSINDAGLTVGWALNDAGLRRPVAWSNGAPADLGTLGGDRGEARAVNNAGQVVGQARNAAGEGRAFLWTAAGGMVELPMTLGGNRSAASAINEAGVVAGSGRLADGKTHAVRYDPATGARLDLGTLGGDNSFANGINDAGHVAGLSDDSEGGFRPFFWSPETGLVDVFGAGDLGVPLGSAYDINNSGQVVGYGEINNDYDSHAFVWTRSEGLKNLNDRVVRMPGLELYGASGINNLGQITGWGALDGRRIGYRLDPATRLKRGHADVGLAWEDGELKLHIHDESTDTEHEPEAVVLHVPALAQTAVPANPAFAFLGTAEAPVWILPQTENPKLLFLGLAAEEVDAGVFVNDELRLRLVDVVGPGDMAVYAVDGFGQPVIYMNSGDGISAADTHTLTAGAHQHVNWAFTEPGLYRVKFQAAGTLVAGGARVESDEFEVCFEVIGLETRLALRRAEASTLALTVTTQDGIVYQLQSAVNVGGPWSNVGQPFIGTGRDKQLTVPIAGSAAGFYRIFTRVGN